MSKKAFVMTPLGKTMRDDVDMMCHRITKNYDTPIDYYFGFYRQGDLVKLDMCLRQICRYMGLI